MGFFDAIKKIGGYIAQGAKFLDKHKGTIGNVINKGRQVVSSGMNFLKPIGKDVQSFLGEPNVRKALADVGQLAQDRLPVLRNFISNAKSAGQGFMDVLNKSYKRNAGIAEGSDGNDYKMRDLNAVHDSMPITISRGQSGQVQVAEKQPQDSTMMTDSNNDQYYQPQAMAMMQDDDNAAQGGGGQMSMMSKMQPSYYERKRASTMRRR